VANEVTIPDHALPACCVRIDVGGSPAGSGFFVAPGVVVTCYHVLRLERLSSQEADPELSVVSPSRRATYVVRDWREWSPTEEDDLAILRVEPADDHPFVLLDTGLRARDELHTYGFPGDYPDGAPTSLTAEGWMGGKTDRWLKLAQGQVRGGMSGSPVLNLRTGAVCGVLKRTIDSSQWIGGYAVSVRALLALSPKLGAQNLRHHMAHTDEWFRLLPADEQRLLLSQRSPETPRSIPSQIIVLTVDQSDDRWEVTATVYGRDAERWVDYARLTSVAVDLNTVRALVARLFRDWASRESTARGRVEPGEQIRLLGEILSSALLRAELAQRFDSLVDAVEHGWLEIALHFADLEDPDFREFVELPWEHLYLPARPPRADVYFARAPRLAFVRALEATPKTSEPRAGKLSLLVVSAAPPDYPDRPDADASLAREVEDSLAGLRELALESPDSFEVAFVSSPRLDGLMQALGEGVYDIVHYVGFGRFDVPNDRLALDTRVPGSPGYVNASDFAACMEDVKPRLVVLEACRGAEPVPADLATFGPELLMRGSDAVIAYQYPVAGALTRKFNRTLYTALADGAALEMAVQTARRKVWMSESESRAFLSPALFLRNPGGFRLVERRERAARSRVGALSGHA